MVPSLLVLLAALGPAQAQGPSLAPPPLNLTVYYESLCPDSKRFVVDQLAPLWSQIGNTGILTLNFVPWGKAWERATGRGPVVSCQHGAEECWGNRLHGCVLRELESAADQLSAVSCLLSQYHSLRRTAPRCVAAAGLDWARISNCTHSQQSLDAALQFGRQTNELDPPLTFVPTMTLNGSQGGQALMLSYLEYFICETWRQHSGYAAAGCPTAFYG